MAMKPLPNWAKSYEAKQKDSFTTHIPFWGTWVDENAQGIQVAPPYQSTGTTQPGAFNPLAPLLASTSGAMSATILASAWQAWYLSIQFAPSPPVPPFLAITSVTPSSVGVAAAYATLLSGLIAEMSVNATDPVTGFLMKGTALASLFNAATLAAGVQISGLSMSTPPVPLVLPLIPVM